MRITRLDGLRGIAILLVFFYHQGFIESFGWAGVDLFFVLSGYLITRILRGTRNSPVFWKHFYVKRIARLAPVLAITLCAVGLLSRHVPWLGFLGYVFFLGDWVDLTSRAISMLTVMWSLAVEEHFYLVWPTLVRKVSYRGLLAVIGITVAAEPLLRFLATPHVKNALTIYFLTPFRLDAIALGSLLALATENSTGSALLQKVSGSAAVFFGALFFLLLSRVPGFNRDANTVWFNSFGYTLVALMFFFSVAWVIFRGKGNRVDRALSFRPLTFVGDISYGMYLFEPIISVIVHKAFHVPFEGPGVLRMRHYAPLTLLLTIAVAAVSFKTIEERSKRWGSRVARRIAGRKADEELVAP